MWYLDDDVMLYYKNGGNSTLMGYLYGPGAIFKVDSGLGGAVVKDITGQTNFGLVYIPPDTTKQPHEAKFSWQTGVVGYSYNGIKTAPAT